MAEPSGNDHLFAKGLSLTALAALFLALRLFAITDYSWGAAFSIAGTLGVDDVGPMVIGTLMASPVLGGVALAILLPEAVVHQIRLGKPGWSNAGNLVWLVIVAVFTTALVWTYRAWWVLAVAAVLATLLLILLRAGVHDPEGRVLAHWFITRTGMVVAAAALILAAVVQVPWVALERIETRDGVVHGYVMENPPGFLKVLTDPGRDIRIIDTADVTGREEIEPEM